MKENKSLDNYLNLCTEVYELSKPTPPEDAYQFYRHYAATANGPILEPMCGTGRFLLPLLAEGYDISGFDASNPMLNVLHSKAHNMNLKANVWQAFIEDINLTQKYPLIFIPSGSFGLITGLQKTIAVLKKFYNHLSSDGILLFEAETLQSVPTQCGIWRGDNWTRSDGSNILASFLDLPVENNIGTVICRYELVQHNTIMKTEIEKLSIQLYDPKELASMLTDVGFKNIKMLKAFDVKKQADPKDEIIVFKCRK